MQKSAVHFRPAPLTDLPSIVKVAMACFPQDNRTEELATAWHRAGLAAHPKMQYFVAVADGRVAGYISWSFVGGFQSGVVELEQIGVHPDFQGQGIGTKLITESLPLVQAWLKQNIGRGLHVIKVDTATNNEVQRLYRKTLGAEVEATLKDFLYGNDEVIMIKRFKSEKLK